MSLLHWLLVAAVLAAGIYLFGHPKLESRHSRLVRGVAIWIAMILTLRILDYLILS